MKVLRLGLSDDTYGTLADAERSWFLAERAMENLTGESWETIHAPNWPSAHHADDVDAEIERSQPNMVVLCAATFWVAYPSLPLGLRRRSFPGSRQLARLGWWSARKPLMADRAAFHFARGMLTRSGVAAFHFEPSVALERTERLIHTILRHESVVLAVRGPLPFAISGSPALRQECERRRATFDTGLANLCESLHITYQGFSLADMHPRTELFGDRVHVNALGHQRRAEVESALMIAAWQGQTTE